MESKGRRKRTADQLQSSVIQDQTVQSLSAAEAGSFEPESQDMTPPPHGPDSPRSEKVVIQFGSRTIKGYLDSPAWSTVEEMLIRAPHSAPESLDRKST